MTAANILVEGVGGRSHVRKALYMATIVAIRWNPVIRKHYFHLKSKGKKSKVAIVACMRKLLITINAMAKSNSHWIDKKNLKWLDFKDSRYT